MIKVRFEREIHIYRVVREMGVEGIRKMVQQTFRKRPQRFQFVYVDGEGDQIEVGSDQELQVVMELAQVNQIEGSGMLKLIIKEKRVEQCENEACVHDEDVQKQFELLSLEEVSQIQELGDEQQLIQTLAQERVCDSSDDIAQIVRANIAQLQKECIDKFLGQIQCQMIKDQVESYLESICSQLVAAQERKLNQKIMLQISRQKNSRRQNQKELVELVEKSLRKLMPAFIERVSEQTVRTVRSMLSI